MHVVITGISHKTASLALREQLALDADAALRLAQALLNEPGISEAVALSTCNRTELYVYARDSLAARDAALAALAAQAGVGVADLAASAYSYSGESAITHLFRVTSSLDSMVVGEAQIVAQMKTAYQLACEGGCTKVVFNRLFRHALEVGKRVRTETAIGERPVSVSSAAVELAKQVFGKLQHRQALILGAGEMSELTATHLRGNGIAKLLVSNRTKAAAEELAARVGGDAVAWEDLEDHLAVADIVISSTSAPHFVLTREHVERAMKRRKHRPIFFIDIAVPRDLDPEINRIDNAYLYDIDDLQQVVEQNRGEREREATLAEAIVAEELGNVTAWLRTLEVVPTIATLREAIESIKTGEMARLSNRLADLTDEQRANVEMLANSIVNKILHLPTVRMKEVAGRDECYLYVDAVRDLFGLDGSSCDIDAGGGEAAGGETGAGESAEGADGAVTAARADPPTVPAVVPADSAALTESTGSAEIVTSERHLRSVKREAS
jgi:glutamyl-tRNA reductase